MARKLLDSNKFVQVIPVYPLPNAHCDDTQSVLANKYMY